MPRNEVKQRSVRKALKDVSNNNRNDCNINNNGGFGFGFSKFVNSNKKLVPEKEIEKQESILRVQKEKEEEGGDFLDRLLLVQSDLSSLTHEIDELVAQAFKLKVTNKQSREEIESFTHVLSDMLSSLKPWVPRFQKALSGPSMELGNQLGWSLADESQKKVSAVHEDENLEVESPEQTTMNSLISPSPLVSWKADCNVQRGKQLFLLTPLPISKTLSSKHQDLSKTIFERIVSNPTVELPSLLTFSGDVTDDLLEGFATNITPSKPSNSVATEAISTSQCRFVSTPKFSKRDHSATVMTPCLKMSPPKSCVLLEPISESSYKDKDRVRKSTPFPVGIHSQISGSSSSEGSEDLALKYPELLGIQQAYKSRMGNKELEASPNWSFSPPKTCVLLEPPEEISVDIVAPDQHLPINVPVLNQQTNLTLLKEYDTQGRCHQINKSSKGGRDFNPKFLLSTEPKGSSLTLVESTPIWKELESTIRTGRRPGENTLKKELWTKFEAASTYGLCLNVSALQGTAKKGFLDMLDEVSCDGESLVN